MTTQMKTGNSCLFRVSSSNRKDTNARKDGGEEEKGLTEDELVGWYHWLNGHKFEQTLADSEGQGSLVCWSPWSQSQTWLSAWTTTVVRVHHHHHLDLTETQRQAEEWESFIAIAEKKRRLKVCPNWNLLALGKLGAG